MIIEKKKSKWVFINEKNLCNIKKDYILCYKNVSLDLIFLNIKRK